MEVEISTTYLAEHLSEVLDQVRERGNRFIIYENGEKLATIGPVPAVRGTPGLGFTARVPNISFPEDGFANDLEAVQAEQGFPEIRIWPD